MAKGLLNVLSAVTLAPKSLPARAFRGILGNSKMVTSHLCKALQRSPRQELRPMAPRTGRDLTPDCSEPTSSRSLFLLTPPLPHARHPGLRAFAPAVPSIGMSSFPADSRFDPNATLTRANRNADSIPNISFMLSLLSSPYYEFTITFTDLIFLGFTHGIKAPFTREFLLIVEILPVPEQDGRTVGLLSE